jgi:hypothetical protein
MKRLLSALALVSALLLSAAPSYAQNAEAEVRTVVQRLFDGMRAADSTMLRPLFHPSARLQSVGVNREGVAMVRLDSIDGFIRAVGTAGHPQFDERISNLVVQVDGNLAQVWMNYTFYLADQKMHCGVNAAQLFKGAGGWQFIQLADTRRRADCPDLPRG